MKKVISQVTDKSVILLKSISFRAIIGYIAESPSKKQRAFMLGYPLNNCKGYAFFNTSELTGGIVVNADNPQDAIHAMRVQLNMKPEEFLVFDSMQEAMKFAVETNKSNS